MPEPTTDNLPLYSVSELSFALKSTLENAFPFVRVRGEISGFKRAASGHLYFNLKDQEALLNAVCWKGVAMKIKAALEDGLEVIATGRVTAYAGRSNYQLVIEHMEIAGAGALLALLEKRKAQLAKEGLFDETRKKQLPLFPQTIGVVTPPTGAVIRDIIHRIRDRYPCHILVWPVLAQGEGAKEQIAQAIEGFNNLESHKPDLIIVARGGGSIEDLWAFNEEIVVRAAANSAIPLISAVGHETDVTLIDFVSDRRAPTPTAAAEMAVPVRSELLLALEESQKRMGANITKYLSYARSQLDARTERIKGPKYWLEMMGQKLDDISERLKTSSVRIFEIQSRPLHLLVARLRPENLQRMLHQKEEAIAAFSRLLDGLHYHNVLKRGFALVRDNSGAPLTRAEKAMSGTSVTIEWADGKKSGRLD